MNDILTDRIDVQYIIAIIIYALTYLYAIEFAVYASDKKGSPYDQINSIHESCYSQVPGMDFTRFRGDQYYIGVMDAEKTEQLKTCFITFWSLSHFTMYSFLGFFAPKLFWQTFAMGAFFETLEAGKFDCHDGLDILMNTSGFVFGSSLRNSLIKSK